MPLRDYQIDLATKASKILKDKGLVYLCMEVRTGKTLTAFETAKLYKSKKVLFVTKKKAIGSIKKDYGNHSYGKYFSLDIVNYEQLHNVDKEYDLFILDEAHCLGQYPKPSERTKILKQLCENKPIIYLSGTPSPESYAQFYHQFWVSSFSPWAQYPNFYKWHKDYGVAKRKFIYNRAINDYSVVKTDLLLQDTVPFVLTYTQQEAGFECPVEEEIVKVPMNSVQKEVIHQLKKYKIAKVATENTKEYVIIGDTAVKEMQKIHQICSGTCIHEDKDFVIFSTDKVEYIKNNFKGKKIAIFYKYIGELACILDTFKSATNNPESYKNYDHNTIFISQISSGREGIDLSTADCLIMYNIDFSAVSYWQARARIQTKDRKTPAKIYWLFTEGGIEEEIYKVVQGKKDFTLRHYKKL